MFLSLLSLLAALGVVLSSDPLSCRDFDNNPVDWFVVYKVPKLVRGKSNGTEFLYLSSESVSSGWAPAFLGLDHPDTPFARTLKPLYTQPDKGVWLLYNDQAPGGVGSEDGHTKGVIGAGREGGFWLVHSVPRYPPAANQPYSYPSTGYRNGQSMLCLSLTTESINAIGGALKYNGPQVYSRQVEPGLEALYAELLAGVSGGPVSSPPWYHTFSITTRNNNSFTVFAKDSRFNDDLYTLVGSQLKDDIMAETWPNEKGVLPSLCTRPYKVMNIKSIKMDDFDIEFKNTKDHSKWAITVQDKWTCIGDINRAVPQEKRGGGTVCFRNADLWQHYNRLIDVVDGCQKRKRFYGKFHRPRLAVV